MNKEQHLTFNLGITNVPSDATCDDNTLQDCVGMVYDNGEHRPIQEPELFMTTPTGVKLLYVHKPNSSTQNYIVVSGTDLKWGVKNASNVLDLSEQVLLTDIDDTCQVMSLGKTLIVNKPTGVSYFKWKGSDYAELQADIPEIDIDFRLADGKLGNTGDGTSTFNVFTIDETNPIPEFDPEHGGNQTAYNNAVRGVYAERKNATAKEKRFVGPFFVRAALKMYDGSYGKMTPPILMVPTMDYNSDIIWTYAFGENSLLQMRLFSCKLEYKLNTDYTDYSDLISDVVLFVSDKIETIDIGADALIPGTQKDHKIISIYKADNTECRARHEYTPANNIDIDAELGQITEETITGYNVLVPRSASDINADIEETSLFYKLAEIGIEDNDTWQDASDKIRDNVMENLTTQERLTDEYFGHSKLSGEYAYVYNSRLNLANVRRTIFEGFQKMLPYDYAYNSTPPTPWPFEYHVIVTIETNDGATQVEKSFTSSERIGMWFYYPDARAKRVRIYRGVAHNLIVDQTLKEHKGLNGAYYFAGLPVDSDYNPTGEASTLPEVAADPVEELTNSIVSSVVNNPYIFNASGYNQAGEGTVMAVSTITQAISQGQFGGFPLLVFADTGVWALSISGEGLITNSVPKERDVISSPQSVTQSDDAVFFVSTRGLMAVVGGGNGVKVKCISEQLNGKNTFNQDFNDFLQDAKIAYDYRDSLLWIGREDSDMLWLYNIKTGTFHRYSMSDEERAARNRASGTARIFNFVNNYPDYLLQINDEIFSFMERPSVNEDPKSYAASMTSRPIKLENGMALKSIMQMRQVKDFGNGASMTVSIEGSNDLKNWRQLTHLRGTPWKYYRMTLAFAGLKATDRYAGMILISQERRTNKLR